MSLSLKLVVLTPSESHEFSLCDKIIVCDEHYSICWSQQLEMENESQMKWMEEPLSSIEFNDDPKFQYAPSGQIGKIEVLQKKNLAKIEELKHVQGPYNARFLFFNQFMSNEPIENAWKIEAVICFKWKNETRIQSIRGFHEYGYMPDYSVAVSKTVL